MSNVVTLQAPAPVAEWLVLDIETGNPDEDSIERAIAAWKPPSNVKDESKIAARREEARVKIREKGALLDSAPILCVAIKSNLGSLVFSSMGAQHQPQIANWLVVALDDERSMLTALAVYLDASVGAETVIAGHNISGFDLPKLRNAFVRHRLPVPRALKPTEPFQPMWDTMRKFRFYSAEHSDELFVSLDVVAESFGIPKPKTVVTGAEVPRMHQEGKCSEILAYCCVDVEVGTQVYLAMTQ